MTKHDEGSTPEPVVDIDVQPLRWWTGQPWDGSEIGLQPIVTTDDVPWNGSSDDRRARWLHLASIGVTALAIPALFPVLLENQDGERPFLPMSMLVGCTLLVLGVGLRKAGVRLRSRIGYRIPPSMRELAQVTHAAEAIVREVFSQSFKARNAHRQVQGRLFYYLEELDWARLHQRTKRWCKCYAKIMRIFGQIAEAAATLTGATDTDAAPRDTP